MSLPTLLQRTALSQEKETLGYLKEQRDSLDKISKTLMSSERGAESLRKDMRELKEDFKASITAFKDIREYFEKTRNTKLEEKKIEIKNESNIFSRTISKLLGKSNQPTTLSDYQVKLLNETIRIKNLTENNDKVLKFISKSYEPKEKEKDQKKLAEFIGEEIGSTTSGIGGAIGKVVLGVATLGTALVTQLGALGSALVTQLGTLANNIAEGIFRYLEARALAGAIPGAPDGPDRRGNRGGKATPRTTPRAGLTPSVPEGLPEGKPGTAGGGIKAIGAAVAAFLAKRFPWLAAITGGLILGEMLGNEIANELGLPTVEQKRQEALKKAQDAMIESKTEQERKQRLINSEEFQQDLAAYQKELMESNVKDKDKILGIKDPEERYYAIMRALEDKKNAQEKVAAKVDEKVQEAAGDATKLATDMATSTNTVLQEMQEKFKQLTEDVLPSKEDLIKFFDNVGSIGLQSGEKLNLLPNFGSFMARELGDLTDSVSSLMRDENKSAGVVQLNNNTVTSAPSSPIPFISPSISNNDSAINLFSSRRPIVN